jgi:hypothetical protein
LDAEGSLLGAEGSLLGAEGSGELAYLSNLVLTGTQCQGERLDERMAAGTQP